MMVWNAATFHQITPLDNYVNDTIAANGGLYNVANGSAHVAVGAAVMATGAGIATAPGAAFSSQLIGSSMVYAPTILGSQYACDLLTGNVHSGKYYGDLALNSFSYNMA